MGSLIATQFLAFPHQQLVDIMWLRAPNLYHMARLSVIVNQDPEPPPSHKQRTYDPPHWLALSDPGLP